MPFPLQVLVVVHAAIAVIARIVAWRLPPTVQFLPITWVTGGILIGQISLLSFWLAMGSSQFKKRLLGVLIGTAYLAAAVAIWPPMRGDIAGHPSSFAKAVLQMVLQSQMLLWFLAAPLFAIRKWRCRLARVSEPGKLPRGKLQFTIFQILLLTSVVAVLFALRRGVVEVNFGVAQDLLWHAYIAVVWGLNLFCAIWSSLGTGKTWFRVALTLLTAAALGVFLHLTPSGSQLEWLYALATTLFTVIPTVVVVGSLLVARFCGFRLLPLSAEC